MSRSLLAAGLLALGLLVFTGYQYRTSRRLAAESFSLRAKVSSLEAEIVSLRANVSSLEAEAQVELDTARQERLSAESAHKQAREFLAVAEGNMHTRYPGIRKITSAATLVQLEYLDWFKLLGNRIEVRLANNGHSQVQPHLTLYLINRNGFVTGEYSDVWVFDKLKPGEASVDTASLYLRAGAPMYYHVRF